MAAEVSRPSLTFRNPARVYWWAFFALTVIADMADSIYEGSALSVVRGLFLLAGLGMFIYRVSLVKLVATDRELVIRNISSTRAVAMSDVKGLDVGRSSSGAGWTIRLVTAHDSIPIDAFSHSAHTTRGVQERFDRRRQELADWLERSQQPV
ncbi:hypothetical protein [Actinospica robiniae]|uniref:hypothetical protein n=1 Tax=Actinospica robiniae TaxID=304901 RepID=UPI0003FF5067|nr:hypothetical protein [Actinospica robiniae]